MNATVPPTLDPPPAEPVLPAPDLNRGLWLFPDGHTEPFTVDDWLYLMN